MTELFEVYVLASNVRTCYFYMNSSDLKSFRCNEGAVKIQFGPNRELITYGCLNLTPVSEVPSKCIGIASIFANNLGLKEGELILVSFCDVNSIQYLEILPRKEEDYVILLSCKNILESYLLNQVSVVAEGQLLPFYVFSNISIDVEIGKVNCRSGYGQLKKFTKIKVLHPSERTHNSEKLKDQVQLEKFDSTGAKDIREHMFNQLHKILENKICVSQINKLKSEDVTLKHLAGNNSMSREYKIQSNFLFSNEFLDKIRNRYIIVSNLENPRNTFGPYCMKVLAKVSKAINDVKDLSEIDEETKKENSFLYSFVISLNDNTKNNAFCPEYVMKKLKLFVGSKVIIEPTQFKSKVELFRCSEKTNCNDKKIIEGYSKSMTGILENVKQTIINNFKYNYKINSLILGEPGTGKTDFCKDVVDEFESKFVFCKMIPCKSLRGKKIDTLQKLMTDALKECSCQEPSIFILDDLHALTNIVEDEGRFNRFYSDRIVDLICDTLQDFQLKYNISVIASAVNKIQLSSFILRYGPRLFQNVLTIPAINLSERNSALKKIISQNIGISEECSLDFDKLSSCTNGYTIQDLSDLVDKAVFNCQLRNETSLNVTDLSSVDFEKALSELIPLNLRNIKIKQNPDTKWENVGGMTKAKKTLLEVFSWPVKYPDLLESCPLRLQRNVLLYGFPGTGKTLLAGALANKCGLNFISVKGPEILSKYVGASEEGVRTLFLQAEKTQPCLLFFDEFDSLAPKRGHDNTGVTDRVVNQLLTQLDGVEFLNGVWVLAATSRPDLLDPALLRPGRLDKLVFCDIPDQVDRKLILEVLSQNLSKFDDVSFLEIAEKSDGYTGADLQAVLYNAQMTAIKENKDTLGEKCFRVKQRHLLQALLEVKPSLSQREKEKYKRIYGIFVNSRKKNFVENFNGVQKLTFA